MNIIETSHLTKRYGAKVVLDDVNFCLKEGEIYGLVGRNGAGKTTLIREILGLAAPTSGTVAINGAMSADALAYERKKIGSLIDFPGLITHLSAYENMKAAALQFGCFDDAEIR
ncbi:MAG: ATP-binding cassette domain-containing protein, partial [Clostridia bacterium]|nr:ATP-binding cassette domain-containing protein [Clostridia bacterium]